MDKIRVGIVNYLNTKPLIYGLENGPLKSEIELIGAYPARLADMLREGQIDVGLIPVAAIPSLPDWYIVGNYCIGTSGEVASVCLFSEVPMEQIEKVYLDYQSRSSVALLKWLIREYWGINPELIEAQDESYRDKIKGSTAGLVIGDRALEQRKVSTYIYDLASEWKAITGLPFVFAAWVSTRPLPEVFIRRFDEANEMGMNKIDEIAASLPGALYDFRKYYTLHLDYRLDAKKRESMNKFLQIVEADLPV
ncbi:MAG TPA: menaquinone biosynthesis protein [Chitinophagaceae bacterium]|nr:menaquinone biosynthesis protein [Chitinophagaceae bacterium]